MTIGIVWVILLVLVHVDFVHFDKAGGLLVLRFDLVENIRILIFGLSPILKNE